MSEVQTAPVSPPPHLFGFQIEAELVRDSIGVIYHARQVLYRREVALRLVEDRARAGMRDLTNACRAAEDVSRHHHPVLLKLYEVSEHEGQFYLAGELLPGPSLRERLRQGPLPPNEAVKLVTTVAQGLAHLHENHCLHLGLTSANVYLSGDEPSVGDVGLSELLHQRPGVSYPGDPHYAAPEQLAGHKADARADVFALGRLLMECLSGTTPSDKTDLTKFPPGLAHICKKATEHSPSRRYSSVAAFIDDLSRFSRGEASAPGVGSRMVDWIRSNPAIAALSAALLLVLFASIAVSTMFAILARQNVNIARDQAENARQQLLQARAKADEPQDDGELKKALARAATAERKAQLAEIARDQNKRTAEEVQKAKIAADKIANEERHKRGLAETNIELIKGERQAALDSVAAASKRMAQLHVQQGLTLMETGDLGGALTPFVQALDAAVRDRQPEEALRLRVATLLSRCPRPTLVLAFPKNDAAFVRFSPDGSSVLIAGADGEATVRNSSLGEVIGKKVTHGAAIAQATFSPDGKHVLSGDVRGRLRVWKVETGDELFEAVAIGDAPSYLSFSADGKRFIALAETQPGAAAWTIRETTTGEVVHEPNMFEVAPRPVALSPDGQQYVVCGTDQTARIFVTRSAKQVGPALEHAGDISVVTYSPDGKLILTAGDGVARLWAADTGKALTKFDHDSSIPPQFDESGRLLLTVAAGAVRIHDTSTSKEVGAALRPRDLRHAVMSPDGRFILVASAEGTRVMDLYTGRAALPQLAQVSLPIYAALSRDGARALLFDGRGLRVWDLTAGEATAPIGPAPEANAVFTNDAKRIARLRGDSVQVYDVATGEKVGAEMKHKAEVRRVIFSESHSRLITLTDSTEKATPVWEARVWEVATGKPITEPMEHLREVNYAAFVGADKILTVAMDKNVRLWDAKTGKLLGKEMDHGEDVTFAVVSPDVKRVVSVEKGGKVRTWYADKGEESGAAIAHEKDVLAVVFSADSKHMTTCCADGTAAVWEIGSGKRLLRIDHAGAVKMAVFSADGKVVVTGGADGIARMYSLTTGEAHGQAMVHDGPVSRVAFSEDGRWLLTASGNAVWLWDAATGEPLGPSLPHAGGEITAMSLSKAGDLVMQAGPGTRWERTLKPDARPVEMLRALATSMSGREEDVRAVEKAWNRVASRYPGDYTPPRSRLEAWAKRGAEECETRGLFGGAVRHLDLLLERSDSAELHARRGKALAGLGRHKEALADYDKAIEKMPNRWQWRIDRAATSVSLSQWDAAATDLTEASKHQDRNAMLWRELGRVEAERSKWKQAAEALAKAVRFGGDDASVWYEQALALLAMGDVKEYKLLCGRMLKKFGNRSSARRALADACSLAPDALIDYEGILAAAEEAAKSGAVEDIARLGALQLRAGQKDKATDTLEKLGDRLAAIDLWLLALAQQAAGEKDKATATREKAGMAKPREGATWQARQALALLKREAVGG